MARSHIPASKSMGVGTSGKPSSTFLSPESLPDQLFVEGAGSARVNGKFVLRTGMDGFPTKSIAKCKQSAWYSKDDDEGCFIGFLDVITEPLDHRWIIFTDRKILYVAPTIDAKTMSPRLGRCELGGGGCGATPAPIVNLQPAFLLTGWMNHNDRLNGEYLPLDNGTKLLNGRPIFKHTPVVGDWAYKDRCRMYWSHGAWRIGDKEKIQLEQPINHPEQTQCLAFVESDATHPSAIPAEVVWKGTTSGSDVGKDKNDFELVETSARIYVSTTDTEARLTTLIVRPWFDTVTQLQSQAFATDTPSQRQQLFLGGERLQDDGRVLAKMGVVAGSTVRLVVLNKIDLLDALFAESGTVSPLQFVGGPFPAKKNKRDEQKISYFGGIIDRTNGHVYLVPRNAAQAAHFDPVTNTWETFGDIFPETEFLTSDKWGVAAVSSFDNCMYAFPLYLNVVHRILKIDPIRCTAQEVGEDLRPLARDLLNEYCVWHAVVAAADGCIYGVPCNISFVVRFDPRTKELSTFGQLEDTGKHKYWGGVLEPSGRYIFCAPALASRVLCIDTQELTLELIGPDFGRSDGHMFEMGKWWGAALGGDNCIYCTPAYGASRLLRIDPATKTVSLFGPNLQRLSGGCPILQWPTLCTGMDGCLYGQPFNADRVLRIDPFAGMVSTVGEALPADQFQKHIFCDCDRDGAIWFFPVNLSGARMFRLAPGRPKMPLLTTLLQPKYHVVLRKGLCDMSCYGPALAVALWREAVRTNGDRTLVCRLLEAAAIALPMAVTVSIKTQHNARTACILLRTILSVLPPQENDYVFNPTHNTWDWHQAEAHKRGMCLASAASNEEHVILRSFTKGEDTWLGGYRRSTRHQPSKLRGDNDWEWSDGTPFLFTNWTDAIMLRKFPEGADRICMNVDVWSACHPGEFLAGIYRKSRYSPPLECIRLLATDREVLPQCFAASDQLRGMLLRILYYILSLKDSAPPAQTPAHDVPGAPSSHVNLAPALQAIAKHLEKEWPTLATAFRAVYRAPPALSGDDRHRILFLSHFVATSTILRSPSPNKWQPLPESADDWSWPPATLVPLRAAGKLVERLQPDTVRAVWPVLAGAIATVLVRMVDVVRADPVHTTHVLTTVFQRERKASLETYQKQLRRARRDPTYPEFKAAAVGLVEQLAMLRRKERRVQTIASFPDLYSRAHILRSRFNNFLAKLAQKCAVAKALQAPLKGCGRALEKLVLRPGAAAKIKAKGVEALDSTTLLDILRGSLECPNFTEIVFVLELLQLLDVDMGDPKKAMAQGWDLDQFQIRIIHVKDRFTTPTSGGWADAMVNFSFALGDDTHHVMELQLQHAQMLVVRKEGKAHARYNSFRSAFELLEAVGREPHDSFEETPEDMPLLNRLEQHMHQQQQQIEALQSKVHELHNLKAEVHELKAEVHELKAENEAFQSGIHGLKVKNESLAFDVCDLRAQIHSMKKENVTF